MTTATLFAPLSTSSGEQFEPRRLQVRRRSVLCAAVVVISLLAACATTPAGKAYQSIATCNASAQAAVKSFGVLYQANKVSDPVLWATRYDKVQAAYVAYQTIASAAVDAAKSGGETPVILAGINQSLNELTSLLATFGVH